MPMTEPAIRLVAFGVIFLAMTLWELLAPRRPWTVGRAARWPSNLAILAVDALAVRVLIPTAAFGVALIAAAHGFGLFPLLGWPAWLAGVIGFVVLDLAIYGQHVVFHHVPWLWRLHRVHHADPDIDVTTGGRFHPIEILISMALKIATVALLGIPAPAVFAFEVMLNATSMFNHANAALPARLDHLVRLVLVTPDMHRIHHSVVRRETDSNFGFNLPWWDRLFRTYRAAPAAGHDAIAIGLPIFRDRGELRLDRLITQPFRQPAEEAAPVAMSDAHTS
ncbi:MAG TPA: sterol desaturase family protein [Xanthobacteraceae bacterium]